MKRYRRLRRLKPDTQLIRRRADGETYRELAPDYDVAHTTLSRYFSRPDVDRQVKAMKRVLREERRDADAKYLAWLQDERAERLRTRQRLAAEARAEKASAAGPGSGGNPGSAPSRRLEATEVTGATASDRLLPSVFASWDERLGYYERHSLDSEIDRLNYNDAVRGRETPAERRARETGTRLKLR